MTIRSAGVQGGLTAKLPSRSPFPSTISVKKGDTLSTIAKNHGTTVKQLIAANPQLKDPNKISAGSQLHRPALTGKMTCRPPKDEFKGAEGHAGLKKPKVEGKKLEAGLEGRPAGLGAGLGAKVKEDPYKMLRLVGTGGYGW